MNKLNYLNFKLTKRPVFEDNPEFKSVPEFEALTEKQMRYVMYVDWFRSPYRMMELEARKQKAAVTAGYKLEKGGTRLDMNGRNLINGKTTSVEAARKVMIEIQHDEESELVDAVNSQLRQIIEFLKIKEKSPLQLEKAVKLMAALPDIYENKQRLLGILNVREPVEEKAPEESPLVTANENYSLLDEFNEEN